MEQIAALRAEWFARLSEAIEGAQRVAWQLRTHESASIEARELFGRLEAARIEVESLKLLATERAATRESEWLQKVGWSSALLDPRD